MPNVACNTSSFLKSNCKYMRTAESESRSQLNGEGEAHTRLFEYRRVLEMRAELWTVTESRYFIWSLTVELMLACERSSQQEEKLLRRGGKKKKSLTLLHGFMLSDRDNGKKKPTENNQSMSIFQLVRFRLVALVFASVT